MSDARPIIYILDASIAITGAFVSARQEARTLKNHARCVLVLPHGSTIPSEELTDFWRVQHVLIVNPSKSLSALLRYVPALLGSSRQLHQWMKKDNAQHLQLNDFYLMHGVVLRLLGFRGIILQWVRCHPRRFAGILAVPLLALAQISANHLVAVSQFIQSAIATKAEILYEYYAGPIRAPREWKADEKKSFVYIGNYIPGKGQDMALTAFAKAAAQDSSIMLNFYGGDMGLEQNRNYRAQLQKTALQTGFGDRITFSDFIADSFPMLEHAYAALNFSASESFSMTVLEASGAGVPVIATASGGPQEILQHGSTGYIVPVGDASAAADQMLALANDPALVTRMGQAASNYIQENFSENTCRARLLALLQLS